VLESDNVNEKIGAKIAMTGCENKKSLTICLIVRLLKYRQDLNGY
jgi:hypothetical protein